MKKILSASFLASLAGLTIFLTGCAEPLVPASNGENPQLIVNANQQTADMAAVETVTVKVFEAYDCDKLKEKSVIVPAGEDPIKTTLKYLPGPGGESTVAEYSTSFKVEEGIARIDWPAEMANLSNIDTSCASQAFLQPIEKTLTQFDSINTVIHSMGGSVEAFYTRMQMSCPEETKECTDWLTYTNNEYGFSIQYPPKYKTVLDTYGWKNSVVNFIETDPRTQSYRAAISIWNSPNDYSANDSYSAMKYEVYKVGEKYAVISYMAGEGEDEIATEWQDIIATFEVIK